MSGVGVVNLNNWITVNLYNGQNYMKWSFSEIWPLGLTERFGLVDGRVKEPPVDDLKYGDR